MLVITAIPVFILIYKIYFYFWKYRHLPPGPFPLPFIGNTHAFKDPVDQVFQKWKDKYGDIMTYWLGSIPIVSLHNAAVINETFYKDGEAYTGRVEMRWNEISRGGALGIFFSEGLLWQESRRFTLQVFRNFGLGRNLMQERVLDQVCAMISHIKKANSVDAINLFDELDISVGSIINSIIFGYTFSRENRSEFQKVKKIASDSLSFGFEAAYRMMEKHYEMFRYLPVFSTVFKRYVDHVAESKEFFNNQIEKHRKSINFEAEQEPTDFVEAYLRHQYALNRKGGGHNFTNNQLFAILLDVWVAGQESTSSTLSWLFIYLIKHPQIQSKAHLELDEHINSDRVITIEDKKNLNYINAIIAETQRYCNLVPMNVPHRTTRDVEIMGYKLPKGTVIVDQISTVLHDERYFEDAKSFKPERFINENGVFFQSMEFMPFGVGKRSCMGKNLARLELFLFAANLLNQFRFSEVESQPITDGRVITITINPVPWKVISDVYTLEALAQTYASQCQLATQLATDRPGIGQTAYAVTSRSENVGNPVLTNFDYLWDKLKVYGSLTTANTALTDAGLTAWAQMASAKSTSFGCGYSRCTHPILGYMHLVICNYYPAGPNMSEQIYAAGAPCTVDSDCTSQGFASCYAAGGLCVSAGAPTIT
uniref:SCP domain-containing protein n=1 Tax=Panagrellus redivivus TaxID=6233 RepID=A0A7E4VY01_PANRE